MASLLDRAFGGRRSCWPPSADVRPAAPHNVADALAAAALARAYGMPGRRRSAPGWRPSGPSRTGSAWSSGSAAVDFIDDSKATNPHAAAASLAAYPSVVWIAGGLFRGAGADLDQLVGSAAARLRGVVLLGADRDRFARPSRDTRRMSRS